MISAGYKMPREFKIQNRTIAPSFSLLYKPIRAAMNGVPHLESRGNRPLQMTFEDQLKALIFSTLRSIPPPNIYCRSLKKMILPVRSWLRKRESRKAASLKPLIPEALNNLRTFTKTFKSKLSIRFQKDMLILETLLESMVL